jgi:hypothetical protein
MNGIDRWVGAVSQELGLSAVPSDTRTILDMTKDVAHNVDRPAAPVTAYLVGIAVGRGKPLSEAIKCVQELADSWEGISEES